MSRLGYFLYSCCQFESNWCFADRDVDVNVRSQVISHGSTITIEGEGMKNFANNQQVCGCVLQARMLSALTLFVMYAQTGNLYVTFDVEFPKSISPQAHEGRH